MKKSLLSILAVLFGMTTPMMAQSLSDDYVPLVKEGAKWECDFVSIFHDLRPDWIIPYSIEIKGDTIIDDVAYKCCVYTFEESSWKWEDISYSSPAETLTLAFIREDVENKKVYARFSDGDGHDVYTQFGVFYRDCCNKEILLYDFANINNPEQEWQKAQYPQVSLAITTGKISIDGVERNCYSLGENGEYGHIIEGIGFDGYGYNTGDLMCQHPDFVGGTDEIPVFKAYKNTEGKTIYTTGDAANVFNGVGKIEVDNNAPIEYFNLQGIKVANPQSGIFIKVQGEKATKELIK